MCDWSGYPIGVFYILVKVHRLAYSYLFESYFDDFLFIGWEET